MATIALLHFDRLFPPQHGGARYLRRLAEILARQGHCCVVVMLAAMDGFADHRQNVTELPTAITNLTRTPRGDISFSYRGVTYRATLREDSELKPFLWRTLREKTFDIALVGDEHTALSVLALNILRELAYCRVVYCVHTMYNLPFGERPVGARTRLTDALAGIDAYLTTSSFGVRTLRSFTDTPVRLLYPDPSRPVSTSQPRRRSPDPLGSLILALEKALTCS